MEFINLLYGTMEKGASDLHITVGLPPIIRVNGKLEQMGDKKLTPREVEKFVKEVLNEGQYKRYMEVGEIDMSYSVAGIGRYRVNVYRQRGSDAMAIRTIGLKIPTLESLGFPDSVIDMTRKTKGLVLVTGPAGSGKSTTLAAMINQINNERSCNIITIEDPIEFLHKHNKSMINQREIGHDSKDYVSALRAALREDPDVILVGEMRDLETMSIVLTAAETGHLVFSTLPAMGASSTIDRIVDVFPPYQQQQIKLQLSAVIEGIVSQQLVEKCDGSGRVAALEILSATPAIRNMIREGKTLQIDSAVQTGSKYGMKSLDMSLVELYRCNLISRESLMVYCVDKEIVSRMADI